MMEMNHWKKPESFRRFLFETMVLKGIWICIKLLRNKDYPNDMDDQIINYRSNCLHWIDTFSDMEITPSVKEYREKVEFPPIIWKH